MADVTFQLAGRTFRPAALTPAREAWLEGLLHEAGALELVQHYTRLPEGEAAEQLGDLAGDALLRIKTAGRYGHVLAALVEEVAGDTVRPALPVRPEAMRRWGEEFAALVDGLTAAEDLAVFRLALRSVVLGFFPSALAGSATTPSASPSPAADPAPPSAIPTSPAGAAGVPSSTSSPAAIPTG